MNQEKDVLKKAEENGRFEGINLALQWVLDVLDGKTNTTLVAQAKCEAIKERIQKLKVK